MKEFRHNFGPDGICINRGRSKNLGESPGLKRNPIRSKPDPKSCAFFDIEEQGESGRPMDWESMGYDKEKPVGKTSSDLETEVGILEETVEPTGSFQESKPRAKPVSILGAGHTASTKSNSIRPSTTQESCLIMSKQADFKALLDLATTNLYDKNSSLYDKNSFRLLEIHVEATERELSRRKEAMEKAAKNKLPMPVGPCPILPRPQAPDENEILECSYAIQDAEQRLAHEFFWFWPLSPGHAADDTGLSLLSEGRLDDAIKLWQNDAGPAAKHNLAVIYHFSALEWEKALLKRQDDNTPVEVDKYWSESTRFWLSVTSEEIFWSRLAARIRAINDRSLTTEAVRRIEHSLPVTLMLIDARFAIAAYERGNIKQAQRNVARLYSWAFPEEAREQALRIAIEPARAMIKTRCENAKKDLEADMNKADQIAKQLLENTKEPLGLLDLLLHEKNPARMAEHDQIADTALSCIIKFGNETKNWRRSLELLDMLAPLAVGTAAEKRIMENRRIAKKYADCSMPFILRVQNPSPQWGSVEKIPDALMCFFCKQNVGTDNSVLEVEMHGDIHVEDLGYYRRITWRHCKVKVPRCPSCKNAHRFLDIGIIFGAIVVGVFGLRKCVENVGKGDVFGGLVVLAIFVGVGMAIGYMIANSLIPKGVRPRSSKAEYPEIKELLAQGWTWGKRPRK